MNICIKHNIKTCLSQYKAFTLVELSIVIVVISLIAAGITAGNSLMKSAKINSTLKDMQTYLMAYNTFKLQYNGLPGDLVNAGSFWVGATNGNGDKRICCTDSDHGESISSWNHLSRANLVPVTYRGTSPAVIGTTHPTTAYGKNTTFWPRSSGGGTAGSAGQRQMNVLAMTGIGWWGWLDYQISVQDSARMDQKIDDGLSESGKFYCWNTAAWSGGAPPCSSGVKGSPYLIANKTNCTCEIPIF